MRAVLLAAITSLSCFAPPVAAAPKPPELPAEELRALLHNLLLANLPNPLIEKSFNWGAMKDTAVGIKWKRQGLLLKPEVQYKQHNDGLWRRVKVTADAPNRTLKLGVSDLNRHDDGKLTFVLNVALPVHVHFEQQLWESGLRLYSGSTRARANVGLRLHVESICRLESSANSFFPDLVYRMRVTKANLMYDDLVVEHTLGVGGDAAKILGGAFLDTVKLWRPSLEQELLVKANAAVVKAADTKEIRVSFAKLLRRKKAVERKK